MDKKKIIIPILIVLVVVLFAIGIFSYANYNSTPKINTNYGSDYDPVEESTEYMISQYQMVMNITIVKLTQQLLK